MTTQNDLLTKICEEKGWDKDFMKEVASTTLIRGIHHCHAPLFERTMENLNSVGLNRIWILDTGKEFWGKYNGPYEKRVYLEPSGFTGCMHDFQQMDLPDEIERILMIDNDCFIFDPIDTLEYLYMFAKDNYDFVSISGGEYPQSDKKGNIIIPKDLSEFAAFCVPSGMAYCILKKDFWQTIPVTKFFNIMHLSSINKINLRERFPLIKRPNISTLWWAQIGEMQPKFGVHRMQKCQQITNLLSKYSRAHSRFYQYEVGKWLHFWQMTYRYKDVDNQVIKPGSGTLWELDKGYFCKYFPDRVGFIPVAQHKKFVAIWTNFLKVISGKAE